MTQEQLTQEILGALYAAYRKNPKQLLKGEEIGEAAIQKFGSDVTAQMVTKSFNSFRSGQLIDQLNYPDGAFAIRLNEYGVSAYRASIANMENKSEKRFDHRVKLWTTAIAAITLLIVILKLVFSKK
jgi:hypothetical protein